MRRSRVARSRRKTSDSILSGAQLDVNLTHIGGPTVLIEVGGWPLLTDPTFDPPGQSYGAGARATRRGCRHPGRRRPHRAREWSLVDVGLVSSVGGAA